jgi:hypothetical protein
VSTGQTARYPCPFICFEQRRDLLSRLQGVRAILARLPRVRADVGTLGPPEALLITDKCGPGLPVQQKPNHQTDRTPLARPGQDADSQTMGYAEVFVVGVVHVIVGVSLIRTGGR